MTVHVLWIRLWHWVTWNACMLCSYDIHEPWDQLRCNFETLVDSTKCEVPVSYRHDFDDVVKLV